MKRPTRCDKGLVERSPKDLPQRRLLADNYRALGDLRWQTNQPAESQKDSETALRIYTELLAEQPDSVELRLTVARTNYDIGQLFSTTERHALAVPYFQKTIAEELRGQFPQRTDVVTTLAVGHQQLGNALSWDNQQEAGEAEMAKSITLFEPLVAANPNDSVLPGGLYQAYLMTSSVYENIKDDLAYEFAVKAFQVAEKTLAKDPLNRRPKHYLAVASGRVGLTMANLGKAPESIPYLERAISILQELSQNEKMNQRFKAQLALTFLRLGDARRKQGDFSRAHQDFETAVAAYAELVAGDPSRTSARKDLASANKLLGQTHEDAAAQSSGDEKQSHEQLAKQYLSVRGTFSRSSQPKTPSRNSIAKRSPKPRRRW